MKTSKNFMILSLLFLCFIACKQEKKESSAVSEPNDIQKETPDIRSREVTYSADTTELKGYLVWDENKKGKSPGILVVHEWWGHNDYSRQRAEMLAELGYVAFALDMYGDGKQAKHPDEAGKFAGMVMKNMEEAEARFNAAMEVLKNDAHVDPQKIAAIGYCFGGSVVLTMADAGADLAAVAAFHSGVQLPIMPNEKLKAKVLVCNGANDSFIPPETVTAFKKAMDSIHADYKYIAYENAVHSFTSKAADSLGKKFNMPLAYNQEADEKSWEALKELLRSVF
ncbi:dienelactone hydrolase family protein [Robertkochia solimangrovi]|uniref:dienelactone hydrolase family protein n=1 Tax=Robertkochia solimangrovi TaxID=2213046 RepID=UPI00117CD315|nr:dienelactone hydrolase family protein [Robertkochia solimangrovi]TRZ45266.1 dienelactone hydrolase family protein [Robertkochia solimangrovi]